jgi:hypothetical protein
MPIRLTCSTDDLLCLRSQQPHCGTIDAVGGCPHQHADPHLARAGNLTRRVGDPGRPRARRQNWKTLTAAYGAGMSRFRFLRPQTSLFHLVEVREWQGNMRWDRIAKAWTQVVAKVAPLRRSTPEAKSNQAGATRVASSTGDFYKEPGITPYRPDNRRERSASSQHLSC